MASFLFNGLNRGMGPNWHQTTGQPTLGMGALDGVSGVHGSNGDCDSI